MAGPLQLGDIISISKLAWDVYNFGWANDFNATRQYAEFGRDVRGLAENLDILTRVVKQADESLRRESAFKPLRWDPSSLQEIIGDYNETLTECRTLIADNNRYRSSGGPLRNIEWNVLVAPAADRLRARIALHNSKLDRKAHQTSDLLYRVREDIRLVHQDLANRITAVHSDLHRLIGVLVPDLDHALAQQSRREPIQLEIPPIVADGLQHAWTAERQQGSSGPSLQEMADVFVFHYDKSTVKFTAGILVENRIPDIEQYVSLLKCIWVMQHIRESPELGRTPTSSLSHWPSYIKQLEDDLVSQCDRFKQDLVPPSLTGLQPEMLDIWPEKELVQLVDVVTRDALMEQVLNIPMQGAAANVQRKLQVLRRMGADGKRFRINITGVEQGGTSRNARRQAETIDFDITSIIINPLYAMPSNDGVWDMVLRKDERVAKLTFMQLKDAVKFQHATTGFKVFDNYSQYNALVSFVVSGRREPIVEKACVQLWVPKRLEGQIVTNNESVFGNRHVVETEHPPWRWQPVGHDQPVCDQPYGDRVDVEQPKSTNGAYSTEPIDANAAVDERLVGGSASYGHTAPTSRVGQQANDGNLPTQWLPTTDYVDVAGEPSVLQPVAGIMAACGTISFHGNHTSRQDIQHV
ncbi:hypothetical protein CSUB01_00551 [Colletotrichum sublineola]|uniref:Fungal N-terminal domain-containing protein n=1 Tax=Colletotrichum sublineola TaxID=1173701 RepID=A0A066X350_COLSU|nr:hypothetical protein CSUB01_00551 [Colletotrichum sublineola]